MGTPQEAWGELGSKLTSLGLKLKLHYEQEHETGVEPDPGVRESLERLGEAIGDAFDALGNAVDDDAVRTDAKDSAHLLIDAISTTFAEAGTELRDAIRRQG